MNSVQILRRDRLWPALLTAALAMLPWWASAGETGNTAASVATPPATATVIKGDLYRTLPVVGELRARWIVNLAPQVGGRVVEVLADVGDKVDPSRPVVKLDRTFFELEVAQQEAGLKAAGQRVATLTEGVATAKVDIVQAQLMLEDAKLQFDRMRKLYDKPAGEEPSVSKKMYEDAELRWKQAEAARTAARQRAQEAEARVAEAEAAQAQVAAALKTAQQRLAETEIRPKFAAVVTKRLVAPGDMVASAPATTLMELQDLEHLELYFSVPQDHAGEVKAGDRVFYRAPGATGKREGVIERILPLGEAATRTYRCRVLIDNPDGVLKPGLLVQVRLILETRAGVTIAPADALRASATGWEAQVLLGDRLESRAVQIGFRTEEGVEVIAGLQPGDVVARIAP